MGHGVGCECDGLLFAGLMICGFSCSVLEKRETKRKREKEIEMMMNKKEYLNEVVKKNRSIDVECWVCCEMVS